MLKRILAPLAALAIVVAIAAPASAVTAYPDTFTLSAGSKITHQGVTVMKLPSSLYNSAVTDRFQSDLNLWGGMTLWVCVTGATTQNGVTQYAEINSPRFPQPVVVPGFNSTSLTEKCTLTGSYVGWGDNSINKVRIRAVGYAGHTLVRTVTIYPAT